MCKGLHLPPRSSNKQTLILESVYIGNGSSMLRALLYGIPQIPWPVTTVKSTRLLHSGDSISNRKFFSDMKGG